MRGLTQQQLAELIGITYQQAHKYEVGMNRVSAGRLYAIAQALQVGVEYFFEGLGGERPVESPPQRLMLDMAREFGFRISTFHHAVEAYKIADLLRESNTCASMWADWWGFKMESYDAINENIPLVHAAGACAIVHSDDPNGIQRLNQEAAKALADGRRMGLQISDEEAWRWLSINPARALGIENETGSLRIGKRADVVLWNGNPYSVYTRPQQVWIDGALLYDMNNPRLRPVTDFELGQPGEGDVK